jgi:hypothetical protein
MISQQSFVLALSVLGAISKRLTIFERPLMSPGSGGTTREFNLYIVHTLIPTDPPIKNTRQTAYINATSHFIATL